MIIEPTNIKVTVPSSGLIPSKESKVRQQMQKEFYGNPNVTENDKDFILWKISRRKQGLLLSNHILDDTFDTFDPFRGRAGNHFPVQIKISPNQRAFTDTVPAQLRSPTQEEKEYRLRQHNDFYYKLYAALKNKQFKAHRDLAVQLYFTEWEFKGFKDEKGKDQYPYKRPWNSPEPLILQDNGCDFTIYKFPEAEKCKGKSRLSFYLSPPVPIVDSVKEVFFLDKQAEISILYEMASNNRERYPLGQNIEKLFKLSKCQYSPEYTMSIVSDYLVQDIQFYDSTGEPAVWWLSFIERLKRLETPIIWDREDPHYFKEAVRYQCFYGVSTDWDIVSWGNFPYYDEESGEYWQMSGFPGS